MKLLSFKSDNFEQCPDKCLEIEQLSHKMKKDSCRLVKVYWNKKTNEVFEVSEIYKQYRCTLPNEDIHAITPFGEWKDLME